MHKKVQLFIYAILFFFLSCSKNKDSNPADSAIIGKWNLAKVMHYDYNSSGAIVFQYTETYAVGEAWFEFRTGGQATAYSNINGENKTSTSTYSLSSDLKTLTSVTNGISGTAIVIELTGKNFTFSNEVAGTRSGVSKSQSVFYTEK